MLCQFEIPRCTYHVHADDLTGGLLDLLQAAQEVPVTGLSNDRIGSEDSHAVEAGGRVGLGGQVAANDLVLLETTCRMLVPVSSHVKFDPPSPSYESRTRREISRGYRRACLSEPISSYNS